MLFSSLNKQAFNRGKNIQESFFRNERGQLRSVSEADQLQNKNTYTQSSNEKQAGKSVNMTRRER